MRTCISVFFTVKGVNKCILVSLVGAQKERYRSIRRILGAYRGILGWYVDSQVRTSSGGGE